MSILIPIDPGDSLLDLQTPPLEGVVYTLEIRWNVRASAYFMNIWDQQGTTLLRAGIKLTVNNALDAYGAGRTPPGVFVVVDTSGAGIELKIDELGDRGHLVYYTAAELGIAT